MNGPNCIQSIVVASFVSSVITTIIIITISATIHAGVWFYRKSYYPDAQALNQVNSSGEGAYESVDDKATTTMSMTTNEAYATTTMMT